VTEVPPKNSDLGVRIASAVVMVAVAGTALWLGGWVWTVFVVIVALGVLWEWWGLVRGFVAGALGRVLWQIGGLVYIGTAAWILVQFRDFSLLLVLLPLLAVIATDIGAYFAGRTFGGPKIAPAISPSKTWSGLAGGSLGAGLAVFIVLGGPDLQFSDLLRLMAFGAVVAVVAQAGDFFESWMKRRAGAKDSGNLIPGHGGLFDRVDGLIAVAFVGALLMQMNYPYGWP
jgi:phosphatidate cytidylyltransferase